MNVVRNFKNLSLKTMKPLEVNIGDMLYNIGSNKDLGNNIQKDKQQSRNRQIGQHYI